MEQLKLVQNQVTWRQLQGKQIASLSKITKMAEQNMILIGQKKK